MKIIEMRGINKRFGSLVANEHVDFDLEKGEIHALLGENGAGKTTLMRILYGLYRPDEGEIRVEGRPVTIHAPKDAIALGIGMVTQHFALVPTLTVAENVVLGFNEGFRLDRQRIAEEVAEAARRFGLEIDPEVQVGHLSVGQRQRVEILKALYRHARVLILDEPTAVLTPQEVEALFATLRRLQHEGLSVIFITHKLAEVMAITDRVTVLRDGKAIATVRTASTNEEALARMMVGRESFGVRRETSARRGEPLLRMEGISAVDDRGLPALKRVSLTIHSGEILGIAGVGGNGQHELAEVLSGLRRPTEGRLLVEGRDMTGASPAELNAAGVGRIPEDRHEGIVGELSVADNMALETLPRFVKKGRLDRQAIIDHARRLIEQFQIKAKPTDRARTLSGGNMQKLLLARVLSRKPKVVIAPQPTRGLDIGATDYVRSQLLAQRERGAGVLLISEDLDEILALSDRIAVIYEGEIVGILPAQEADVERLGLMMAGAVREEVLP